MMHSVPGIFFVGRFCIATSITLLLQIYSDFFFSFSVSFKLFFLNEFMSLSYYLITALLYHPFYFSKVKSGISLIVPDFINLSVTYFPLLDQSN